MVKGSGFGILDNTNIYRNCGLGQSDSATPRYGISTTRSDSERREIFHTAIGKAHDMSGLHSLYFVCSVFQYNVKRVNNFPEKHTHYILYFIALLIIFRRISWNYRHFLLPFSRRKTF